MTEQEAQQAQTVAGVKRYACIVDRECGFVHIVSHNGDFVMYADHAAIIDSQTHKIAEQAKEIERLKNGKTIGSLHHQIATLEVKMAEQAKEIERLKNALDSLTFRPPNPQGYMPA